MLSSLFETTTNNASLGAIMLCTFISLILGMVIAFTHKVTSKYNQSFLITLAILPTLVEIVMLMVNGNLGTSVAILGAFSLVRFRSLPGTSKEILSIFFAMAIGLATGMGQIIFAVIMTIIVAVVIILLSKLPIFGLVHGEQILKVTIPENLDYTSVFDKVFDQYLATSKLERAKTIDMGSLFELSYRVTLKPKTNEKELIDAIRVKNGNLRVVLSNALINETGF